jgi:hypothetical protein
MAMEEPAASAPHHCRAREERSAIKHTEHGAILQNRFVMSTPMTRRIPKEVSCLETARPLQFAQLTYMPVSRDIGRVNRLAVINYARLKATLRSSP